MKFLQASIIFAFFALVGISLSLAQGEHIYEINFRAEDIASDQFREGVPEILIDKAKTLARQNPDSALLIASKAVVISQKLKQTTFEASAFRRMGHILYGQDDFSSALHYFLRSKDVYEPIASAKELRLIYNNLGASYEALGKNQEAIDYYLKSLEQAELEGNVAKQISSLSNLGELSTKTKQYKSAISFLERGINLATGPDQEDLKARLTSQLGNTSIKLPDFTKAQENLELASNYYRKYPDDTEKQLALTDCLNGFGTIAKLHQSYSSAKSHFTEALEIYEKLDPSLVLIGYNNLGEVLREEGKYEEALSFFQKALKHPSIEDYPNKERKLFWNLSLVYGKLNDVENAYKFQNAYAILTDSIYEVEIKETASRAELLYTKARSERKEEAAKVELERQKMFSNYLMGALFIAGLLALIFYLFMRNYAQRKEALRLELQHKEESNKLLVVEMLKDHEVENLNAMLDGQESERKRIARDLHDSMGGTLAAVQLTLASLRRKLPKMSEIAQKNYDKAESLLDKAYEQMRGISHNLVDLSLKDGGLSPALKQLKETLSENTHININMNYESLGTTRLDSNVEQHSYRITQELFQNIIKHAEASQIQYELNYSPVKLEISIEDNGKGFSYSPGNKVPGIGLNNILTRVRQLEGEMDIQTKPGAGTRIKVDIPLVLS